MKEIKKAFIFDMDGVMIDSEKYYSLAILKIIRELGHEVSDDYTHRFIGSTNSYTWSHIIEDFKLPNSEDYYIDLMLRYKDEIEAELGFVKYPGIETLIKDLYDRGYHLAIASSSRLVDIERTVEELAVGQYFEYLVSGETVEHSKPAPDIYLKAADLLGVEPEHCIVIEDSHNGARAAKSAGMYCIGYIDPEYPPQDLSMVDISVSQHSEIDFDQLELMVYGKQ